MLYLIILGHCLSPSLGEFTALVNLALDIWLKEELSLLFSKAMLYPLVPILSSPFLPLSYPLGFDVPLLCSLKLDHASAPPS